MVDRLMFRGIAKKFLFWFLVVAVVPLGISLWVITTQMIGSARQNVSENLAAIRDMKVSHFRQWLDNKQVNVKVLAEDTAVRDLVEKIETGQGNREELLQKAREVLGRQLSLKPDFLDFFLVDSRTGVIFLATEPSIEGLNRSGDAYFTGPLEKNGTYIKDIYRSEALGGEPTMTISTPVYCHQHGGEHITAVLVGRLDLENSLYALLRAREGLGQTGEMVLVNRESIALNTLAKAPDAPLRIKITAEPARLAAQGGTGVVEEKDYAGEKVLSAYTHLPELGWGFVVKMDQTEIYAPIAAMVRRILITGLAFFLLTVALALAVSRGLARPLESMAKISEKIARGELDARNTDEERNDEIGDLAGSINTMAERLQYRFGLLEGLSSVTEAAVGSYDREGFARAVFEVLMARIHAHMGVFYVLSGDGKTFEPSFSAGMEPKAREPFDRETLEGILGFSSLRDDVVVIRQIPDAAPFVFRGPGGVVEAREIMALPLLVSGSLEGLICLGSLTSFQWEDEELVRECRHSLSTGLDRILASERMQEMTAQIKARNEELVSQTEELTRQSEELQEQNVELEHQRKMIEEANRLKSEFLSNMSHELRTPLNSILALSRVLQRRGGQKEEDEAKYLDVIERNGRQLLDLINDILDLSKIESGRVEIRPSLFSLSDTVISLLETLRPVAIEKEIFLEADIPKDLPLVKTDDSRLRQILRNLLDNAVKFTPEGGVAISVRNEGGEFVIRVKDTGIGIPKEELPFIFDEFRQVDGSSSRQFEGTGLGLAIAKKSAWLLAGRLTAESREGEGSTFTLSIPMELDSFSQKAIEGPFMAGGEGKKVIVVEDDVSVASTISSLLSRIGYEAIVARSGHDALRLVRQVNPVAMTLDIIMPEMDGWEVLQKIKGDPETSALPVVIISVCDEVDTAKALGADGYLCKPVIERDLSAEIQRVCGKDSGRVIVAGEASGRRTILMVEDNDIAARQVKHLIEEEGIAFVEIAPGGQQALEYMKENTPDAIILDLMMPGVDGFSVLDQLRGRETTAGIPVLILTAKDLTREDLSRLRSNNVQQLVQKGDVDREEILRKIRLLFGETVATNGDIRPDVLYIEDNPDNMTTMRAILGADYRLTGASNGKEGLKKAAALKPRVILLDLSLPDMDGFEVLEKLKSDAATRDIPVAAVTARAMKGDRRRALEAGCKAYVTKPVDPDEMRPVLERLLMS
ncbi:MAG TPA: response regulator [Synergistales bacterium]|nr:response regulator [Synergistales bacterium]HRV71576.1 response regulator [Thermovirgaceae bacterium]